MKTEEEINKARQNLLAQLHLSATTKHEPDASDLKMISSLVAFDWILGTNSLEELLIQNIAEGIKDILSSTKH